MEARKVGGTSLNAGLGHVSRIPETSAWEASKIIVSTGDWGFSWGLVRMATSWSLPRRNKEPCLGLAVITKKENSHLLWTQDQLAYSQKSKTSNIFLWGSNSSHSGVWGESHLQWAGFVDTSAASWRYLISQNPDWPWKTSDWQGRHRNFLETSCAGWRLFTWACVTMINAIPLVDWHIR